jgi:hypothetical protein
MTKKKLIEEIKLNPARYYRAPSDVKRDRRFSDAERLEILAAWERDARAVSVEHQQSDEPTVISQLRQVLEARSEMEKKLPPKSQPAETKGEGQET